MKKLLYIILLFPLWANAQNVSMNKTGGQLRTMLSGTARDTVPMVTGALVDGWILKYHAATNKWYASPDGVDSLGFYVKKTGDTMTGPLNGTSAAFSGNGSFGTSSGNLEVGYSTFQNIYKLDINGKSRFTDDMLLNGMTLGLGTGSIASNLAFGTNSLFNNTTGANNVAIGTQALEANTTGGNNTALGRQSLLSNNTGGFNTAVGVNALRQNTSGTYNIAQGYQALYLNSLGSWNIGIGANTFYSGQGTNHRRNIAIGFEAGRYASDGVTAITSAQNSILIGNDSKLAGSAQTNQIVIGASAVGLGSNTTVIGTPSTVTSAIYGNLLLGTTTDSGYKLDVNGTGRFTSTLTANSFVKTGGTGAQFLMANGSTQDTTTIQTVSNFFPKGDTRYLRTSGGLSFGTFGSTPNAQGGSYSGGVITLQPASASFPGGVTTGAQIFSDGKSFTNKVRVKTDNYGYSLFMPADAPAIILRRDDALTTTMQSWDNVGNTTITGTATATGFIGPLTGSATTLANTRTIFGQNFNGSANVSGSLTGATDITASGNVTLGGFIFDSSNSEILAGADGSGFYYGAGGTPVALPLFLGSNSTTTTNIRGSSVILPGALAGSGDRFVVTSSTGQLATATIGTGLSYSGGVLSATGGSAGTVTGSGTAGKLAKWNSASDIGDASSLTISGSDLSVAGTVTGTNFIGPGTGLTGTASSLNIGGNSATATALQTPRTIAGVPFDGTANISLNNNAIINGAGYTTNTGTVTSIISGNGMNFTAIDGAGTVILGTPSSITSSSTNSVTSTSHTHEITSLPFAVTASTQVAGNNSTRVATTAYADAIGALKANIASPTFTGTVSGIDKTMVGLSNVDNTSDASKPVSTATQTALNLKANLASPALTGTPTAPTQTAGDNSTKIATTAYVDATTTTGSGASKQSAVIFTDVNSSSGGAIDLAQHTISTATNGDRISFEYTGNFAANANSKPQMVLTVDGTDFTIPSLTPGNNEDWIISGSIIRVSSTIYKISFSYSQNTSGGFSWPTVTSGATLDTNSLVITLTAPTTIANNDIVLSTASIQKFNAP